MSELNAEFVAKMRSELDAGINQSYAEAERLIALAEERVMIEENYLSVHAPYSSSQGWLFVAARTAKTGYEHPDFSTAIRAVVTKIKEGK